MGNAIVISSATFLLYPLYEGVKGIYKGGKRICETMSDPEIRNEFFSFKKQYEREMRFYDRYYGMDPARNGNYVKFVPPSRMLSTDDIKRFTSAW
jgi:hypothetical protein